MQPREYGEGAVVHHPGVTVSSALTNRLLGHLRHLAGERHPQHAAAALKYAEQYLHSTFQQLGCHVKTQSFKAFGGTYHNIVATIPGSPPSKGTTEAPLILAAHYDTYEHSPGADDNASALAVLLEAARELGGFPLKRPVLCVAFCLEEFNLLGSRAYVAALRKQGRSIHGAIVLECVGYASSQEGTQQQPPIPVKLPPVGDFLGIVGNDPSKALVSAVEAAAAHGPIPLKTISMTVPGNGEAFPDTRRSDHAAFWDYGFPALMLTDTANFRNPHYHQSSDTIETLNLPFLEQVERTVVRAAHELAR